MGKRLDKALDMFKGPTGGYDLARVLFGFGGVSGVGSGIGYQGYDLFLGHNFNPLSFFGGLGILMSSFLAAAYGIKQKDKGVADAVASLAQSASDNPSIGPSATAT